MSKKVHDPIAIPYFERINAWQKLLICIVIATIVYFIVEIEEIDALTHIMIGWDTFSLSMIIMSWTTFFITNSTQIREQSKSAGFKQVSHFRHCSYCYLSKYPCRSFVACSQKTFKYWRFMEITHRYCRNAFFMVFNSYYFYTSLCAHLLWRSQSHA